MYRQFNIQQFYVLPIHFIYVFRVDLRTNSDYFPEPKRLLPAWRWGVKFLDGNNEVSALCTPLLAVWVVRPRLREDAVIVSKEPRH